jgi:hypothetical protein
MSTSFSFTGSYQFDSASLIEAALDDLRDVRDDETEIPDPFDQGEIVIDRTEVRFAITGARPSHWYDYYDTIVQALADRARAGEVVATCEDVVEVYKAGPLDG